MSELPNERSQQRRHYSTYVSAGVAAAPVLLLPIGLGWLGLLIAIGGLLVFVVTLVVSRGHSAIRASIMCSPLAVAALFICVVLHPLSTGRGPAGQLAACGVRLKQVAAALHAYHDDFGCFPPVVIKSSSGEAVHSWRVLILPYLGKKGREAYQGYRFDEPWDSPNNLNVARQATNLYRCPSERWSCEETSYVAVTGPGTAWTAKTTIDRAGITDAYAKTVQVIEVVDSQITWTQPLDLPVSRLDAASNRDTFSVGAKHGRRAEELSIPPGPHALLLDGTVVSLATPVDQNALRRAAMIGDGETEFRDIVQSDLRREVDVAKGALVLTIALVVLAMSCVAGVSWPANPDEAQAKKGGQNYSSGEG